VRTVEEGEREAQSVKDARKAAKDAEKAQKVQTKIAGYQKRIDSAVKRKNASALGNIFESLSHNFVNMVGGRSTTKEAALSLIERDHVWTALGLLVDGKVRPDAYRHSWTFSKDDFVWPEGL